MDKWICKIWLYIYDPATGAPGAKIRPHTAFEDIPLDYWCPVCGAPRGQFEELSKYEKNIAT